MRLFIIAIAAMGMMASPVKSACIPYESRSPDWWAAGIERHADIVMVAEVVQAEDGPNGKQAELRPITVYKGKPSSLVLMSLPPTDEILTEFYSGFEHKLGEKPFLVLYSSPSGFKTSGCDYVIKRPAVHEALLQRLAHR